MDFVTSVLPIMLSLIIILLIICVCLLFIVLKKNKGEEYNSLLKSNEDLGRQVSSLKEQLLGIHSDIIKTIRDEFARSRLENAAIQSEQRKELATTISEMRKQLEALAKDNYEFNLRMQEMISRRLAEIGKSNEEKLEQMRLTVDEKLNETLTKRLNISFKTVSDQLENVYKSLGEMRELSNGVTEHVGSLSRILTNVKARGTWAEVQLEAILDQTIPGMYDKNVMTVSSSRNIVEFAVRIPSGDDKDSITYLPIDSKFPVESYIRLCEAAERGDSVAAEAERKALESTILTQAKEITKYINEPKTTPFAIMYLATEGLYSEIISSKSGIAERCHSEFGVMIAGPSTITALLNSLSMGFRAMAINEKAKEVRTVLAAAKAQYEKFGVLLEKAKKKINEAGRSLDDAQNRNAIIQKKLKTVEAIGTDTAAELLGLDETNEGSDEE